MYEYIDRTNHAIVLVSFFKSAQATAYECRVHQFEFCTRRVHPQSPSICRVHQFELM